MSDIVDLDAMAPKSATIKFNNAEVEIPPPTTGSLLKLATLAEGLQNLVDLPEEEIDKRVDAIAEQVQKMIPQLQGSPLTLSQLKKLVDMFMEMALPEEFKALSAAGITPDTAKKAQ